MNVLCLGSEVVGAELAAELVRTFLGARFDGGERYIEEWRRSSWKGAAMAKSKTSRAFGARAVGLDRLALARVARERLLEQLIREDAVVGVTSNPTIFQKALASGDCTTSSYARSSRATTTTRRSLLPARRPGHPGRVRPLPPGLGRRERPGRLRLDGGRSDARLRPRGDDRRGDAPARVDRPAEPARQDPGDRAGAGRDRGVHRARALDQRHADLLSGPVCGGRGGVPARARAARRGAAATRRRSPRSRASSSPASTPRRTGGSTRSAHPRAEGQARDREREARLRPLRGDLLRRALGARSRRGARRGSAVSGPRRRRRTPRTGT